MKVAVAAEHRFSPLFALLVALSAGCASLGAESEPTPPSVPTPAAASPFVPDFDLVAPEILVEGASPWLAGQDVKFRITFPAESHVDLLRVRDILWTFGPESSDDYAVGPEVVKTFENGGLHTIRVTVRDVYDRTAQASLTLSVAQEYRFSGLVRVGDGGQDARPPDATAPNDHVDHVIPVTAGAATMRVRLNYAPESLYCPQTGVCVPGEASLFARALDPDGEKVAEAATGAPPRLVETPLEGEGDFIVRVSGDKGVDMTYNLTILILWPEA